MYIPKKYGHSKIDRCPFCQKHATSMNRQNVPVCPSHKNQTLDNLKCACGSTLDIMHGKFGVFFSCMKCGNMNLRKVMELNALTLQSNAEEAHSIKRHNEQKEITVRSDDPRYFD